MTGRAFKGFPRLACALLLVLLASACATTTPPGKSVDAGAAPTGQEVSQPVADPFAADDPLQGFNRRMYRFNALADRYVLLPVVHVYDTVVPGLVRTGVGNFFSNLGEITTFINSVLQLKPTSSGVTLARFVVNSTLGIGGLFDPATQFGLVQRNEDFGQTLGRYGVGAGPYLVLPFLGPSDLRDAFGTGTDVATFYVLDPLQLDGHPSARLVYDFLYALNKRDNTSFRYYQTGSPFEYLLVRAVYLNYRKLQIAQ